MDNTKLFQKITFVNKKSSFQGSRSCFPSSYRPHANIQDDSQTWRRSLTYDAKTHSQDIFLFKAINKVCYLKNVGNYWERGITIATESQPLPENSERFFLYSLLMLAKHLSQNMLSGSIWDLAWDNANLNLLDNLWPFICLLIVK